MTDDARADISILDRAAAVLNEALAIDPLAVECLLRMAVPCKQGFVDHPTIVVHGRTRDAITITPLGLINGIVASGNQFVFAEYGGETCPPHVVGFKVGYATPPDDEGRRHED